MVMRGYDEWELNTTQYLDVMFVFIFAFLWRGFVNIEKFVVGFVARLIAGDYQGSVLCV